MLLDVATGGRRWFAPGGGDVPFASWVGVERARRVAHVFWPLARLAASRTFWTGGMSRPSAADDGDPNQQFDKRANDEGGLDSSMTVTLRASVEDRE